MCYRTLCMDEQRSLERGERAPDFVLPSGADGASVRFYGRVGGTPAILVLLDGTDRAGRGAILAALDRTVSASGVPLFVIAGDEAAGALSGNATVFRDADGAVRGRYRLAPEDGDAVLVLDANVRVLASVPLEELEGVEGLDLADAAADAGDPFEVERLAPVLRIPDALEPELCARLVEWFETEGNVETGVEETNDGRREDALRPEAKRRRDHTVTDAALLKELTRAVGRRVMPELQHAFAYRATRFEGFKIARYDAESKGWFAPHRDNLSPSTAHRRFAMSLNLNADYDGGQLRFPEYGSHLYRPDAGEALVFSGSLLHEVRPVVEGRRYVLLSFLFGEEGDRRR